MNARTRMSSKGQIVVPKEIREAHGWGPGTEFEFIESGKTVALKALEARDPRFPPITWDEFERHRIKMDRPFPTDEEIDAAMLAEARRRFDATRR
ncbi:MAG: AbrB/MazE/SpoVT family DNA-binding domain-containing protein [Mesorhizobium sp.]